MLNARGWRERLAVLWIGDFIPVHQDYYAWLARKLRDHGIDNFTFTGWHDSPFSFYRYADATVLPSVSEEIWSSTGGPIEWWEARVFRSPTWRRWPSGFRSWRRASPACRSRWSTGPRAWLVAPGDATALAGALERLLSAPASAAAMGKAGARRVEERFSTREFVEGMVRVTPTPPAPARVRHARCPECSVAVRVPDARSILSGVRNRTSRRG